METIYKIYDLKKYYTNFVGANPIAVVSDLAEDELLVKCPELQSKRPFVLVTKSQWKEMKDIYDCFELDEEKHRIAALRHEEKFSYQEGQTELIMHEHDENPVMDEVLNKIALEQLHSAIEKLPECQRRRILIRRASKKRANNINTHVSIVNAAFAVPHQPKRMNRYL